MADMDNSEDEPSEEEHDIETTINSSSPHIESLPLQVIYRHRLSSDEIKSLLRFTNHKAGVPSNTLYLKNLHPKVTEEDLQAIFGHHQSQTSEKLKFRLLTGRMKGLAFVEFPSKILKHLLISFYLCSTGVELATSAMELVHGYLVRQKPIIICYGNKGNT